ncbi:MAG: biotin/lipoyl-binding protein [Bacteroidia bacterium]|nr:biotin/lipoyl-binding protein [Bacteroidia bacterium]
MIRKVLIANRGEIACRVIHTCARLGIQTVAVYSEADTNSPHVQQADEAVCIGAAPSIDSYLNQTRIIEAAKLSGADAIHPGYGFLSENEHFALSCEQAGIIFIGPTSAAITCIGSKKKAKDLAIAHNVPVVPGYHGEEQATDKLAEEALKIGFPILIKAAAGGGGKGMRVVQHENELLHGIESAKREALAAFGNDTLLLERYFETVRHIEIQIMGDTHGNLVYLHERECSIQRRHQKIIEEAPSPALLTKPELRQAMGEAAIRIAKAANYTNAGTVEFILTPDDKFYFLEVNTRLQVEHPVTEAITGLDLVEWQIMISEGEKIPLKQSEIPLNGAAVEVRLYAESPDNQFLPCTGTIHRWKTSPYARIDSGVTEGNEISIYYDPMIAKVITWGKNRQDANRLMSKVLAETIILGLTTNLSFLKNLIEHPQYLSGNLNTRFVQDYRTELLSPIQATLPIEVQIAALWCCILNDRNAQVNLPGIPAGWRNNPFDKTTRRFSWINKNVEYAESVCYNLNGDSQICIKLDGQFASSNLLAYSEEAIRFTFGNRQYHFDYYIYEKQIGLQNISLGNYELIIVPRFIEPVNIEHENSYHSPMPGKILRVLVEAGQRVQAGEALLIMESMKMENTVRAHTDGVVKAIYVAAGAVVAAATQLIEME